MTNGNGQGLIPLGYEKQRRQKGISDGLEPRECLAWYHKLLSWTSVYTPCSSISACLNTRMMECIISQVA